jgi:hypothetical protein
MIPGSTAMNGVRAVLSDNQNIHNINWYPDLNAIDWNFVGSKEYAKAEGDFNDALLKFLYFGINNQHVSIDELITSFGPPTYLDLDWAGPGYCTVSLIYISLGMELVSTQECKEAGNSSSENNLMVKISADTTIEGIILNRPGESGYIDTFGPDSISDLSIKWIGYGDYEGNH